MALNFKSILLLVALTTCLDLGYSAPVLKALQETKSWSAIDVTDLYNFVTLFRIKKAMVLGGNCPAEMIFYGNMCRTMKEYKRLLEEEFDETTLSATDSIKNHDEVEDNHTDVLGLGTDSASKTDLDQDSVIPLAKVDVISINKSRKKSVTATVKNESSQEITSDQTTPKSVSSTASYESSTETSHKDETVASTPTPSFEDNDYSTSERRNNVMATVILIFSGTVVFTWLLKTLYQRYQHRNEDDRDSVLLPTSDDSIQTNFVTSHDSVLACKVPLK